MIPLTWADFMLGQANVAYLEFEQYLRNRQPGIGDYPRDWRYKNGDAFIQDDWVVTRRLTLNLGLRYEHIGDFGDATGRMGNMIPPRSIPLRLRRVRPAGYMVPSNYQRRRDSHRSDKGE